MERFTKLSQQAAGYPHGTGQIGKFPIPKKYEASLIVEPRHVNVRVDAIKQPR
jgi:hypothetical protein